MRWSIFAALFAVALALRVWGVAFGLPDLYHPDEPAYVLQALAVGRGLPDGLTFANPPLFKYLLLGEYAALYGIDRASGAVRSQQDFVDQFRADPSRLYLIARVTSAIAGALTCVATWVLGATVGGRRVGLLSAGLTAITFLLVREAHFGTDDALLTLLVTLGLIACVRVAQRGQPRDYALAGALTGLAFAAKYDGIALLVPLALAARPNRKLGLSALACLGAVAIAFPSLMTETGRVLNDIYVHLYLASTGGYDGLDPSGGYPFYVRALAIGVGWPLLLTALVGTILSLVRRNRYSLAIASFAVALLVALGSQKLYFARFALPAVPALIVEASVALDALMSWRIALGILATLVVALPTLADSVRFDHLLTQTDTRTLAREWIQASLAPETSIAVDAPPLGPTLPGERVLVANDWSLFDLTPRDFVARGVEYVVVSSFTLEARAVDPAREGRRQAFQAALPAAATLVAQFRPYAGDAEPPFEYDNIYAPWSALDRRQQPGPTVSIYRLSR